MSTNNEEILEAWELPFPVGNDENITRKLRLVAQEDRRVDLDIESLYDNRFISTATGQELDKLGKEVGAVRKTGETDEVFRKRIFAEYGAQSSNTTYDEFATIALGILDAASSQVGLLTPPDTGQKRIDVEVDGGVLDENPLTVSQLNELLDRSLSAGSNATIVEKGTFAFAGDDSSLEGFNEGTWSSSVDE